MFAQRTHSRERAVRRGSMAFEALLLLPLMLVVIFVGAGVADLVVAEQQVDEASGRAARAAALTGSKQAVRDAVRASLGPGRAQHAKIFVGPLGKAVEITNTDSDDLIPIAHRESFEVRVEIEARYGTATRLAPVGGDEPLVGYTVMQRE